MSSCAVEGCERRCHAHGWCNVHYQRWWRNGDPLVRTKAAHGEPRAWLEAQFASGRDRSVCWLDWPFGTSHGYPFCNGRQAGHLVMELDARPRPSAPDDQMLHACDVPMCLSPGCLRWGNHAENMEEARERGLVRRGEHHGMARLSEDDVRLIRSLYEPGVVTHQAIADRFGVSRRTIGAVVTGQTWSRR